MPIDKGRISSPLEAGPSILEAEQLPPQLLDALNYVSNRLVRKRLHLSLIVVRKDVNLAATPSPQPTYRSESPGNSITTSPARSLFSTASTTLSNLTGRSIQTSISDCGSVTSTSSTPSLSRTRHPSLPSSPKDSTAVPSISPSPSPSPSPSSLMLPECPTPTSPNPYGISLMHAGTLTKRGEKVLRQTIGKAEKKFSIGSGWLSQHPLATKITCPATNDLIRRSLAQNSVLFSSEGLTLLALDRVYTFKCHLHTYSRTLSPLDLTAAVDELRRLVLAQNGRRITKGYLMRAYDWLGVSLAALVDVNEGYKVAYGGKTRTGGIEVQDEERKSPPPLQTSFNMKEIRKMKLSLSFGDVSPARSHSSSEDEEIKVGESAKGKDYGVAEGTREDRGPHKRGPRTPNGFEDITPVTKGEWCFLMVGDGWKEGRTAAVETC